MKALLRNIWLEIVIVVVLTASILHIIHRQEIIKERDWNAQTTTQVKTCK